MKKQIPMQFVDAYLTNLQSNVDEKTARLVKSIQDNFQEFLEEERQLVKRAFIDGYETRENAESTKAHILGEIYIKQKFK